MVAMILSNPTLVYVIHLGQQADDMAGAQIPMSGGHSYHPLDVILLPPVEDMINDIRKESDNDCETWCPNPRNFPTMQTGFQKFEQKLQTRIIRQRRILEVIWTMLLVSSLSMSQAMLLMRMSLGYTGMITLWILPLQALWRIGSVQAAAQLPISRYENGMYWLDGHSMICVVGGYFSDTLEGGRMGDNMEFLGEVLGLFLAFCLFYYYIIHIQAWRAVMRVRDIGINWWELSFWEWHSGRDTTLCMAIM